MNVQFTPCVYGDVISQKRLVEICIIVVADLSQHLPFFPFLCGGYELVLTLGT